MIPNKFGIIRQNGGQNGDSYSSEANLYAVNFDPVGRGFQYLATRKPEIIMPVSYEIGKRFQENATTRLVTTASDFSSIAAVYNLTYTDAVLVPVCASPISDTSTPFVSALVDSDNNAIASVMLKLSDVDGSGPLSTGYAYFKTSGANKLLVTHFGIGEMTEEYIEDYIRNNPVIAFKYR